MSIRLVSLPESWRGSPEGLLIRWLHFFIYSHPELSSKTICMCCGVCASNRGTPLPLANHAPSQGQTSLRKLPRNDSWFHPKMSSFNFTRIPPRLSFTRHIMGTSVQSIKLRQIHIILSQSMLGNHSVPCWVRTSNL